MTAPNARSFTTTQWSLVLAAGPEGASTMRARRALDALCQAYWYPLYAFVRSRGHGPEEAQDLTQAFFARILETRGLAGVDPERGRFRSYLLGAMKHFLANEWHRVKTQKRGGEVGFLDLDALEPEARYSLAPAPSGDLDLRFDREWAVTILDRALGRLQQDYEARGQGQLFGALRGTLTGDAPDRQEVAERLSLSSGAIKVAIHRLRQRFRGEIRQEVAETVQHDGDLDREIDAEMRYLLEVLRAPP